MSATAKPKRGTAQKEKASFVGKRTAVLKEGQEKNETLEDREDKESDLFLKKEE